MVALVLLFVVIQNLQVFLYGVVFKRLGVLDAGNVRQWLTDPVFLSSLFFLSAMTAAFRVWLFPNMGIARTHIVTTFATVAAFALFSVIFREHVTPTRYLGAALSMAGIWLLVR